MTIMWYPVQADTIGDSTVSRVFRIVPFALFRPLWCQQLHGQPEGGFSMPRTEEQKNKHAAYMREWRRGRPEQRTAQGWATRKENNRVWAKSWRERHPDKAAEKARLSHEGRTAIAHRAHEAVRRAIKNGRLIRPAQCENCQSEGGIEAAHHDYEDRLNVRWLCRSCHRSWDKADPKGGWAKP